MLFTSHRAVLLLTATLVVLPACGGSGPSSAPSGPSSSTTGPTQTMVITITSSGVSPKNVTVPAGSQVTFVNNDAIEHLMFSDPHPEHTDCPDINQVGYLFPGQSRQTGNMNIVQTCGFHDHYLPGETSLQGTITTH
jgi:plastocyanin